jgi:dihydrofolate reductase
MTLSLIAALDDKKGIGKNGKLPWHIPSDLKHFKNLTTGKTVIMGRKTFESIGRPLPKRQNIVITSNPSFEKEGVLSASSLEDALDKAQSDEVFVIGGGQIFNEAIDKADKLYLTLVSGDHQADTFFPGYEEFRKEKLLGEGAENGYKFKFIELQK